MRIPPYFVATFAALLPALALAQETSGTIAGVVRDPSQAVLAQARIAVTNEQTGLKRDVETNALGEYRVPFLPVGVYSLRAQKAAFKSHLQTRIPLAIPPLPNREFTLYRGPLTGTGHGQKPP